MDSVSPNVRGFGAVRPYRGLCPNFQLDKNIKLEWLSRDNLSSQPFSLVTFLSIK